MGEYNTVDNNITDFLGQPIWMHKSWNKDLKNKQYVVVYIVLALIPQV